MTGKLSHIDLIADSDAALAGVAAVLPPGVTIETAAARGNAADAACLLGATAAYRARIGAVPPGFGRHLIEVTWAAVAARLAPPDITEARTAGEQLSLDEVTKMLAPAAIAAQ